MAESVGLFLPLPERLARQYPPEGREGEDSSPVHVTFVYIGDVEDERLDELEGVLRRVLQAVPPLDLKLLPPRTFESDSGQTILHSPVHCPGMKEAHDALKGALERRGFNVEAYPDFKPHVTIEYIDHGERSKLQHIEPTGRWRADSVGFWVGDDRKDLPLGYRKQVTATNDYMMGHRPSKTAPLHDLTEGGAIPEDVYTHPQYYADMSGPAYQESFAVIKKMRGKPNNKVTVYRAGPVGDLNTGDWISLSRRYAQLESTTEGVPVHSFKVRAKDVWWPGDDFNEFGYFGPKIEQDVSKLRGTLEDEKRYMMKHGRIPPNAALLHRYKKSRYHNMYGTRPREQYSAYYEYVSDVLDGVVTAGGPPPWTRRSDGTYLHLDRDQNRYVLRKHLDGWRLQREDRDMPDFGPYGNLREAQKQALEYAWQYELASIKRLVERTKGAAPRRAQAGTVMKVIAGGLAVGDRLLKDANGAKAGAVVSDIKAKGMGKRTAVIIEFQDGSSVTVGRWAAFEVDRRSAWAKRDVIACMLRAGRHELANVLAYQRLHAAAKHWSQLPGSMPENVREAIQRAVDYALDNALDTRYEYDFNTLRIYEPFWELVADRFIDLAYDVWDGAGDLYRAKLDRDGLLKRRLSRAPKELRPQLLGLYEQAITDSIATVRKDTARDPQAHPAFDSVWKHGVADTLDTAIQDENQYEDRVDPKEVQRWAAKLGLY